MSNLESMYINEQYLMYSEKQVEKILEVQRDNCYVAIYNKTQGDQELAKSCFIGSRTRTLEKNQIRP
jgi:hypothetical protein